MMRQITIRQLGPDLERQLRSLANKEGISLNRAALKLLRSGAGIGEPGARTNQIGHALDEHMGTWSAQEERSFLAAIESCEAIDPAMWK